LLSCTTFILKCINKTIHFFSKALNCCKNSIFRWNYVLFGLNKMCKAHFQSFAVIISPFHAMGVKFFFGHPHPLGIQLGH
jgi:hypothetical protein